MCRQILTDSPLDQQAIFNSALERTVGLPVGATVNELDTLQISEVSQLKELAAPWYSDQVLPFDVTLAGNNEYGAATTMRIYGIEILNEGSGHSIDDAVSEMQATFVARYVQPWHVVQSPSPTRPPGLAGSSAVSHIRYRARGSAPASAPPSRRAERPSEPGQEEKTTSDAGGRYHRRGRWPAARNPGDGRVTGLAAGGREEERPSLLVLA
jgi:hypothetical protein